MQLSSSQPSSIWDVEARAQAVALIKQGRAIGAFNRGVCAIWGDGENARFLEEVCHVKGEERGTRPIAATLETNHFVRLLDASAVAGAIRPLLLDADELRARLGSLCFLRVPISQEAAARLPAAMVSRSDGIPVIQNWDPYGHKPAYLLLRALLAAGIRYPAITSLNISGQPEIVDQAEGREFSGRAGIPLFLADPRDRARARGSYTILEVTRTAVRVFREGNIPGHLFDHLLELPIDQTGAVPPRVAPCRFPPSLLEGLGPRARRIAMICYLHGWPEHQIRGILDPGGAQALLIATAVSWQPVSAPTAGRQPRGARTR